MKFYHVYVKRKNGVSITNVQVVLNDATDWIRYSDQCWLIYSSINAREWHKQLSGFVKDEGELFIARLEIDDRQGWMAKSFWDWIRKKR